MIRDLRRRWQFGNQPSFREIASCEQHIQLAMRDLDIGEGHRSALEQLLAAWFT